MSPLSAPSPDEAVFSAATDKQRQVLDLLAENRTTKEIAAHLGVSDSAINQRIDPLRHRLGGITRAELTRRYRAFAAEMTAAASCEQFTGERFQVETPPPGLQIRRRDDRPGRYRFEDSMGLAYEPPRGERPELRIVPRLLDGKHAGLARGIAVLLLLLLIVASLVLGLTAAQVLTETLGDDRPGTETPR